jgi:hypothetical protein
MQMKGFKGKIKLFRHMPRTHSLSMFDTGAERGWVVSATPQ